MRKFLYDVQVGYFTRLRKYRTENDRSLHPELARALAISRLGLFEYPRLCRNLTAGKDVVIILRCARGSPWTDTTAIF